MTERWVPLTDAAKELGVSVSAIVRLVKRKNIETRPDPIDERYKLVDIEALKQLYASSYRKPRQQERLNP